MVTIVTSELFRFELVSIVRMNVFLVVSGLYRLDNLIILLWSYFTILPGEKDIYFLYGCICILDYSARDRE